MGKLIKEERLTGVDSKLVEAVKQTVAALPFDVIVVEGLRTAERQRELYAKGLSRTLKSKHIIGKAVDLAPIAGPNILWNDKARFRAIGSTLRARGQELGLKIRSGYDWDVNGVPDEQELAKYIAKYGRKPLVDYPHHEIV